MPSNSSGRRLRPIDNQKALHEIRDSVRQLTYLKQHSETLIEVFNVKLEMTYAKAPSGRQKKGQTYELHRSARTKITRVKERKLEQQIWTQWNYDTFVRQKQPFFGKVCHFIQTYQMPLRGTRDEKNWGNIDLVGVGVDNSPVVIELKLKHKKATDTILRMLVEGLAYACALRRAWNEGNLRQEWAVTMKKNGLPTPENVLKTVPVFLLAPSDFWTGVKGKPGVRSNGKVSEDAWPAFFELVNQCKHHGFPIHFVQFDIENAHEPSAKIVNVSSVDFSMMT